MQLNIFDGVFFMEELEIPTLQKYWFNLFYISHEKYKLIL